jgi:hypothetical protein
MDASWQGTLVMDNVALTSGGPAPGALALVAPSAPVVGCLRGRVELHDTLGGALARAVRPVRVSIQGVSVFSAAGCTAATSQLVVPVDQAATEFWWLATTGSHAVTASDLGADLNPANQTWVVP